MSFTTKLLHWLLSSATFGILLLLWLLLLSLLLLLLLLLFEDKHICSFQICISVPLKGFWEGLNFEYYLRKHYEQVKKSLSIKLCLHFCRF